MKRLKKETHLDLKASNNTTRHYSNCILATSFKSSIKNDTDVWACNCPEISTEEMGSSFNKLRMKV
jgi:hypothetical protein